MDTIYDRLIEYSNSGYYGFHMPGHKRNTNLFHSAVPYKIDITEIEGFDDLHHAEGIIKEAQERASGIYHAGETHFLVNGSTVGILSAIMGVTGKGDTVLVARNCHKSVYHAIYMNELKPVYFYPEFSEATGINMEVAAAEVERQLKEHPYVKAVVIVSPTYDGVVSDVEGIAALAHEWGIPLIVDEAHGAHLGFHPYFPQNSNKKGADLVIHSLHKTLPSLTQTALLHMNGELVKREKVRKYLHMLQSSSPSYVLMASMDACMELLESSGKQYFNDYVGILKDTRSELKRHRLLRLIETERYDPSKIIISTSEAGVSGRWLNRELLEKYQLQMEMASGTYVLAMTSIGDIEPGMKRLTEAIAEIDSQIGGVQAEIKLPAGRLPRLETVYCSAKVDNLDPDNMRLLSWKDSVGYISMEYAYLYPPGVPLVVPGERITEEAAALLVRYRDMGFTVEGVEEDRCIEVYMHG